jgi:S-DNA-T family DNA segregation ATPase FtsK/SpoIIIE
MVSSITRILNKTPLQNERSNVYETNIDDNLFQSILQSRFIGEGVYCLEQLSLPDYKEQYFLSPSFDKYNYSHTNKEWEFENNCVVYELTLSKPNFLPLDTKQYINLFQSISELEWPIFTQILLCRRLDQWREVAVDCYYAYLDGIDSPIANKTIRNVQSKVLNVLNKVSNYNVKRNDIEEVEQKILSNGYRFECRFVLLEPQYQQKFEETVQKLLQKLNLFNEIVLKRVKKSKNLLNLIKNRSFCADYVNQMLSEKEINSLLGGSEWSTASYTPTVAPVKKKGITQKLDESMLLQQAIKLLPFKESTQREVDQTLPKRINGAFKRVKISEKEFKVIDTHLGSSLLKVTMSMPADVMFTQIKKKLEDIQGAIGGDTQISIEMGQKPDTINVYISLEEREAVYFRRVLESEEFQQFAKENPLPFILGESVDGGYLFGCLSRLRHLLIAGSTGSGKSVWVNIIILCLLLNVPSDELDMYLIDPKMVEFTSYDGFPQIKKIVTDMEKATTLLEQIVEEMERRYQVMSMIGARELSTYNKKSDTKMPYIVVVVDEFADLIMVNSDVEDYIVRLGQKARGCGIHLILCTQRPSVNVVTGLIKANMPSRFSFKVTSGVDSKTILDTVGAEKLLGMGDCLCKVEGSTKELERFQAPLLSLDKLDEERIYEELKQLFKDSPTSDNELEEVIHEEPIEKLKRIIVNSGELRVSELQGLMKIKMNTVSELLKQLVNEGFLGKEGRSYVVTADQEEIDKWREGE